LLLVQVHDFEDPVFRRRGLRFQGSAICRIRILGIEQAAQAIELGERHRRAHARGHHLPEPRAEDFRIRAFAHLVFEHAAVFGEDLMKVRLRDLFAGDVREHDAVPERHDRLALVRVTRRMEEHSVALNELHHLEHVLPRLFERAGRSNRADIRYELDFRLVGGRDRVQPPVLHLEN